MNSTERKAYAAALLDCSLKSRMITVYPLTFGEISVKDRVKRVLNYKKTANGVVIAALGICIAVAACFLTNPKIEDNIPADSQISENILESAGF